jgi:hypothetical protein
LSYAGLGFTLTEYENLSCIRRQKYLTLLSNQLKAENAEMEKIKSKTPR